MVQLHPSPSPDASISAYMRLEVLPDISLTPLTSDETEQKSTESCSPAISCGASDEVLPPHIDTQAQESKKRRPSRKLSKTSPGTTAQPDHEGQDAPQPVDPPPIPPKVREFLLCQQTVATRTAEELAEALTRDLSDGSAPVTVEQVKTWARRLGLKPKSHTARATRRLPADGDAVIALPAQSKPRARSKRQKGANDFPVFAQNSAERALLPEKQTPEETWEDVLLALETMPAPRLTEGTPLPANIDEVTGVYIREIARTLPLSAAEELRLAYLREQAATERWREEREQRQHLLVEGEEAVWELIEAYLPLVVVLALKLHQEGNGIPLLTLIQHGNHALARAAAKFEYGSSFSFCAYATWWITRQFTEIKEGKTLISPPGSLSREFEEPSRPPQNHRSSAESATRETPERESSTQATPVERVVRLLLSGKVSGRAWQPRDVAVLFATTCTRINQIDKSSDRDPVTER